ncbi:MAG: hypothetical protein E7668_02675 [Ruminococcaceae bacterium]|nr:hypothetical protein [Oscillospiraceae bacterium]
MMTEKRREERRLELIDELREELEVSDGELERIVDRLVDSEYRKERHGAWIFDDHYTSHKYVRWVCSACTHWQSAQRHIMSEQIFYMNYCPFCGSQMDKPERKTSEDSL